MYCELAVFVLMKRTLHVDCMYSVINEDCVCKNMDLVGTVTTCIYMYVS